ncbi:hypothetical protein R1sor_025924 [Riccia sorocarpa]|uniref:Uncharacterized protein n=1 Tax=Riccia sorocarpa TaxID=122646 RepID=A0ABD3GBH2_9MARC
MDASTCIGCGRSGDVYLVGAVDPELADQIGRFDVVFYVAKRLKDQWYEGSGFDELVKEFTAFPLNSPIICSPTAGFFERLNPTLVFPWWNGGQIYDWIEREFELRWKRSPNGQRREAMADDIIAKYDADTHLSVEIFRKHRFFLALGILDGLNEKEILANMFTHRTGKKYVTKFSQSTDIFAMGYILQRLCGDYFSDMTPKEEAAYDQEKFAKGFPSGTSLPHVAHRMRLREALEQITVADIANRHDYRMTARYWVTYFQDQLMIDPLVCQRPLESKPRAKKHPDGPREIGKDKL